MNVTIKSLVYCVRMFLLVILVFVYSYSSNIGTKASQSLAYAANFPIEITNIKPAGTGSPAIPASNRIFRAYPGIEYNIRAAVVGGLYPFTFSLSGQPTGMTINTSTGVISWPSPESNSGPITLTVTDSEHTTVTTQWSITVTTTGFYFVDTNAASNGTGTLSSPFNSISNMITGTGASHLNDIVYFRGGNYTLPTTGTSCGGTCNATMLTDNAPFTWLGYPGETVNISGNNTTEIRTYRIWYDSLNFKDFNYHGIEGQGLSNYQTIRRCTFTNLKATSSLNVNQGFLYLNSSNTIGSQGYGFIIQDNEWSNYTGGGAIGSLYSMNKGLIEDNYIHNGGGGGVTGIISAIIPKDDTDRLTIRHNKIIPGSGAIFGNSMNSIMAWSDNIEVCFNYFNAGSSKLAHEFFERSDKPQTYLYYYRNTLVGFLSFDRIDGSTCTTYGSSPTTTLGAITIHSNVLVNDSSYSNWNIANSIAYHPTLSINTPQNCITSTNNLTGLPSDNLIDSNGNLTAGYQSLIGTVGWQTTQPNSASLSAPVLTLLKTVSP